MKTAKISSRQFLSELVNDLNSRNLVWLAGAGVSMSPPCSLPSGPEIKDLVMASICRGQGFSKYWKVIRSSAKYQNIVPEIVFQRVYECIGDKLFSFFDLLRFASPNLEHEILAALCGLKSAPILTTNFDLLIDERLAEGARLIHLHGHLAAIDEMTMTINRVGKGLQLRVGRTLNALIGQRTICIVGYSGNDDDIRRAIVSSGASRILWLVRDWDDRVMSNLPYMSHFPGQCLLAKGDLRGIFRALARIYSVKVQPSDVDPSSIKQKRSFALNNWSRELSRADRYGCISKILIDLEEYRLSCEASEKGFSTVSETDRAGWFKNQSAFAMRMVGDFEQFAKFARDALAVYRSTRDRNGLAMAYNLSGLSILEKARSEPKKATPFFRKGIATLKRANSNPDPSTRDTARILLSQILNNLGLSLRHEGKYTRALMAYKQSLALKRSTGDLIGFSQTCINISLLYYRRKDFESAYRWRRKARALIAKFDLGFQEAYLIREMGSAACEQGRFESGIKLLREALRKYEEIGASAFGISLTKRILKHFEQRQGS